VQKPGRAFEIAASVGLAALGVWLRLPYRAAILYEHDSFLFARAMERYDLAQGQPHPPGYIFYVFLAKLVSLLAHDPNRSLLAVNIAFGAAGCVLVFWLGRMLGGRLAGLTAGLFFLTSPLVWFHNEVAIVYMVEGALAAAIALMAWGVLRGRVRWIVPSALLLGVAGGFWPFVTAFLLPMWLFASARYGARRALAGVGAIIAGSLTWYVPNAALMGGAGAYNRLVLGYGGPAMAGGLAANVHWASFAHAASLIWNWTWSGLGWALLGIAYLAVSSLWEKRRTWLLPVRAQDWTMLGLWVVPALLFYLLVHAARPGYILVFFPGLVIFAALGLRAFAGDLAAALSRASSLPASPAAIILAVICFPLTLYDIVARHKGTAVVILAVICFPLLAWQTAIFLFGSGPFCYPVIEANVLTISERINFIKERFRPDDTVVLASEWAAFARYYLKGYHVYDATFDSADVAPVAAPGHVTAGNVVLFDFKLNAYDESPEHFVIERLPISGAIAFTRLGPNERLVVRPGHFRVETAEARAQTGNAGLP
jgi:hypothetical protein